MNKKEIENDEKRSFSIFSICLLLGWLLTFIAADSIREIIFTIGLLCYVLGIITVVNYKYLGLLIELKYSRKK